MTAATLTCVSGQGARRQSDLFAYLTPELREIVRTDTEAWVKRLRAVTYDGRTMRERFTYRGDSLWWFTELYLYRMRRLETALATLVALDAARRQHSPAQIIIDTSDLVVRDTAHTFGRANNLPVDTRSAVVERDRHARPSYLAGLTATLSRLRPPTPVFLPTHTAVAAFVYTTFGRPTTARPDNRPPSYVGQVLEAIAARVGPDELHCIGLGPRRNLRRRADARARTTPAAATRPAVTPIERFAPQGALGGAVELWRRRSDLAQQIVTGDGIRAAGRVREYDLWPVLRRELEAVALLQWPWSARAMDECAAAIGAIKPDVVVTYAEASGWGRALVLEARRRQVPSVGVQHELVTRHGVPWYHEPDEMAALGADLGFPTPDRLLVFDQQAATELDEIGHFPASAVVVTGHPRLDGQRTARLVRMPDAERAAFRRELGVRDDQRLVVLVARFADLGALLPAIVAAAAAEPRMHVAILAHPADTPEVYATVTGSVPNIALVPAATELSRLLAGTDGLITRESTVAINALSIGVPSLIVGAPDHLGPLVDAGIMLGAALPDAVAPGLRALLFDDQVRKRLTRVVGAQSAHEDSGAPARAADRAADAILSLRRPK